MEFKMVLVSVKRSIQNIIELKFNVVRCNSRRGKCWYSLDINVISIIGCNVNRGLWEAGEWIAYIKSINRMNYLHSKRYKLRGKWLTVSWEWFHGQTFVKYAINLCKNKDNMLLYIRKEEMPYHLWIQQAWRWK